MCFVELRDVSAVCVVVFGGEGVVSVGLMGRVEVAFKVGQDDEVGFDDRGEPL
jgi:hypothetical protein